MFSEVRDAIITMKYALDLIKGTFKYLFQTQPSNNKDPFSIHLSRNTTEKLHYKFRKSLNYNK